MPFGASVPGIVSGMPSRESRLFSSATLTSSGTLCTWYGRNKTDSTSSNPFIAAGSDRTEELRAIMADRILVLDGATGTMLQSRDLGPDDFGGPELEGCNEILVRTRPDVILDVHRAYLAAGADLIETDTFGGTPLVLAEYGLEDEARELNRRAAELAVEAAREFSTPDRPRFVVGSIGPTTKAISVTGGITFPELVWTFGEQIRGLMEGGADLLFIETCQDTRNVKAALIAAERAFADAGVRRPLVVSGTIETSGTMLGGQAADAFLASIEHADLLAVGLNCATGPDLMTDHLRTIDHAFTVGRLLLSERGAARRGRPAIRRLRRCWLRRSRDLPTPGGSTSSAVVAAPPMLTPPRSQRWSRGAGRAPSIMAPPRRPVFTGIDLVEPDDSNRPLLVGERTNVIGSKKFREMVAAGEWDEAVEIARRQVKGGAQIIDVCLQSTEGDELAAIRELFDRLGRAVKAPIMIDSTDADAVEVALTYCQGKSIVNSINLEDGEERIEAVAPLLRRYGAAVIFGTIDEDPEQAQAFTRERKARDRRARPPIADRQVRRSGRRYRLRPAGLSGGERRRELHRRRGRDHRGPAVDQGGVSELHDRSRDLQRLVRFARAAPARSSTRSFSTCAPRPGSTWRSSTASGSSATQQFPRRSGGWSRPCSPIPRRPPARVRTRLSTDAPADWRDQDAEAARGHPRLSRRTGNRALPRRQARGGRSSRTTARRAPRGLHRRWQPHRVDRRPRSEAGARAARRSTSSTGR